MLSLCRSEKCLLNYFKLCIDFPLYSALLACKVEVKAALTSHSTAASRYNPLAQQLNIQLSRTYDSSIYHSSSLSIRLFQTNGCKIIIVLSSQRKEDSESTIQNLWTLQHFLEVFLFLLLPQVNLFAILEIFISIVETLG